MHTFVRRIRVLFSSNCTPYKHMEQPRVQNREAKRLLEEEIGDNREF